MSGTQPVIEVTVSPTGEVMVRTKGYAGTSCRQASQFLEQSLGAVTAERMTPEFYQQQEQTAAQPQQRLGHQ